MKLSLPSDFARKIAETLGLTAQGVEGYFEVDEDKAGFFYAKLQPKKWLDTAQFKMLCSLVRDLNGEYVKEKRLWRVPGPYAKKQAPESPKPKADTTSTPQLPSTSEPSDVRGKAEVPDFLKYDKSKPPYFTVPINALLSMPFQSRLVAEDPNLLELVESVKAYGVLEPLLVRSKSGGLYEVVAGERRKRAAEKAGLFEVPVIVKDLSDQAAMEIQYVENDQRKDLTDLERGRWLRELMRRFPETYPTTYALAKRIGKTQPRVHELIAFAEAAEKEPTITTVIVKHPELTADKAQTIMSAPVEKREEIAQKVASAEELPYLKEIQQMAHPEKFVQCGRCGLTTIAPVHLDGKFYCESCAQKIDFEMKGLPLPIMPRAQTLAGPPKEEPKAPEPEPLLTGFEVECPECHKKLLINHKEWPDGKIVHVIEG
jgi:ParB/RepB/Spo0J family partition protein